MFLDIVDGILADKGSCSILDVGGTAAYWSVFGGAVDWSHVEVTLLNLEHGPATGAHHITEVVGDATDMRDYDDNSFDIVHSNSVIEHVGLWSKMEGMAKEVRRLAPSYFVQTPSVWFPIEAHARAPLFQFLPEPVRVWIIMRRKLGYWEMAQDIGEATKTAQSAILLNKRQMRHLFPDAEVIAEKAYGFTKSYIAIRRRTLQ